MITVTSFNEWHEGTMIEPAVCGMSDGMAYEYRCFDFGPFQYLLATATWTETFRRLPDLGQERSVSLELGEQNASRGLYQRDLPDGITEPWAAAYRRGRRAVENGLTGERYMYFWVSDDFHRGAPADMRLQVEFRDGGPGFVTVEYDAAEASLDEPPAYRKGPVIAMEGTGEWRTATVELPGAVLDNRQHSGADLRIAGRSAFVIGRVTLIRGGAPAVGGP
jgi:hypothetical protein